MERALVQVRKRLVDLMRIDPPFKQVRNGAGVTILDRWMATRLSRDELSLLQRLEEIYGEHALAELFAEALFEAGMVRRVGPN